jgi:hypothetical protein
VARVAKGSRILEEDIESTSRYLKRGYISCGACGVEIDARRTPGVITVLIQTNISMNSGDGDCITGLCESTAGCPCHGVRHCVVRCYEGDVGRLLPAVGDLEAGAVEWRF